MNNTKYYNMDLVTLSRFGLADGGIETWAYNFIPLLLNFDKRIHLNVYGIKELQDNSEQLLKAVSRVNRDRLKVTLFPCKKSKIPFTLKMLFYMHRTAANSLVSPKIVLGVGGVSQLLILIFIKKYKESKKILWFRSIFFHEKTSKYLSFLFPILRRIEALLLRRIDVLIANGQDVANYYTKYGLNVSVIPNGVDIKKWEAPLPQLQLPISVAYIGRLAKIKGIVEFIEVVQIIKSSAMAKNFIFHVIGGGPLENKVKILADEKKIIFHGSLANKEIPNLLMQYDVCVALTWATKTEGGGGTSNALLEQMAAGRVIIAWDNDIFQQLLDKNCSYLVEQGNSMAIVEVLYEIIQNPTLAKTKAAAIKKIVANYSLDTHTKKFFEVLRNENILTPLVDSRSLI